MPPDDAIASVFNRLKKIVLTRSGLTSEWQGSQRVAGVKARAALRREDGPNLVIQGSMTLYPPLLAHDLLDRIVTMTARVVPGQGKRAFGGAAAGDEHRRRDDDLRTRR